MKVQMHIECRREYGDERYRLPVYVDLGEVMYAEPSGAWGREEASHTTLIFRSGTRVQVVERYGAVAELLAGLHGPIPTVEDLCVGGC